jgi:protoheme ferro-lyase
MSRAKFWILISTAVVLAISISAAFSNKQDDQNYRHDYVYQDTKIVGKPGVLLTALGQPEDYDFEFFNRYITLIFKTAFPPALKLLIMQDNGTVLMDPEHLADTEEYAPKVLMDCFGKTEDEEGEPYVDIEDLKWVPSRDGKSPGHFLWSKKNGYIDAVEKVGVKIVASYYPKMPNHKVPYTRQHMEIFKEVEELLKKQFPEVPMRWAWTMDPETVEKAVDELIREDKVKTIVHCDIFPVYSSLEHFNTLYQDVKDAAAERAKVVFTPYPGAYPSFRKGIELMVTDEILPLPKKERKLLVLTRHGWPDTPGDPYPELARVYYVNLKTEIEKALEGTNTLVVYADTDFAGDDIDTKHTKLASFEALNYGLEEKYDHIIFQMVDFTSENTDSIFAMRLETFEPLKFKYEGKVPYSDWSKPFNTELKGGKDFHYTLKEENRESSSRVVVLGVPVGPRYRPYVSQGLVDCIATVLKGEKWPLLVLEIKEKKKGMF